MGWATTSSAGYRDSLRSRLPTPSSSFRWRLSGAIARRSGRVYGAAAAASLAAGDVVGAALTLGLELAAEQLVSTAATTAAVGPQRLAVMILAAIPPPRPRSRLARDSPRS